VAEKPTYAIAVTSAEWRSLIGYGELRISKRRVQQVSEPITPKESGRLFAWMPTTVLGDENDIVVLELANDWLEISKKARSHPAELILLSRGAVLSHHCVRPSSLAYLSSEAQREGIELQMGRFQSTWEEWAAEQKSSQQLAAAEHLLKNFELDVDLNKKRPDGYRWQDIVSLAHNLKTVIRSRPKHVESLLRSVREISNSVSGVHSTEAFNIAVNVEWVAARLGKDPLKNVMMREQVDAAITVARDLPWSATQQWNASTSEAISALETAFPKVYSDDIRPDTIAHIVRLVMAAKEHTLSPKDFVISMHHLMKHSRQSAPLLGAAVAGALGPLMTRRLVRSLDMNNPIDLDWTDS
jgi:hypothetical protein